MEDIAKKQLLQQIKAIFYMERGCLTIPNRKKKKGKQGFNKEAKILVSKAIAGQPQEEVDEK